MLLVEIKCEGLSGWGECTAGEHPYFSDETVDTAWQVIVDELAPLLAAADVEHGGECPRLFKQVRGNRMAKAALENAVWDLEAQRQGVSLARLLGGTREQDPVRRVDRHPDLDPRSCWRRSRQELAAGYQRIKLKCKPGWDVRGV